MNELSSSFWNSFLHFSPSPVPNRNRDIFLLFQTPSTQRFSLLSINIDTFALLTNKSALRLLSLHSVTPQISLARCFLHASHAKYLLLRLTKPCHHVQKQILRQQQPLAAFNPALPPFSGSCATVLPCLLLYLTEPTKRE